MYSSSKEVLQGDIKAEREEEVKEKKRKRIEKEILIGYCWLR